MNLVTRAAAQISGAGLSITDLDRMMDSAYGGSATYTGKLVSQTNSLQVGAVWACVAALAGDIATAPFIPYYQLEDGRQPAKDHYLWPLLLQEANPELTAFRFKHLMQCWLCLWGNAYAEIEISGRGQVTALWPWRPDRVSISRDPVSGGLLYSYKNNRNQKFTLPQDRILHLRGLGIDGVTGLSPIEQHKQTLGLSMAITEHGARFFGNGARPLGLLKHPGTLGEKAYDRLKKDWSSEHEGLTNAHRIAILEEGLDWKDAGFNQVDAQYLETMQFTLEDIGRMYGVPPHRIGNLLRCLPADAEVYTEEGPRRIVDVKVGDLVWSYDAETQGLVKSRVSRLWKNGYDQILTIKTTNRTIRVNAKHKMLARVRVLTPSRAAIGEYRDSEGQLHSVAWENAWVEAGDLQVGDTLVAMNGLPESGNNVLPSGRTATVGFAEFCGLLLSDGNVIKVKGEPAYIAIARSQTALYMDHYRRVMRSEFSKRANDHALTEEVNLREHTRQTRFSSAMAARELDLLGLSGNARTKRIPGWVFLLPTECRLGFLRGFLDGDGTVDKKGRIVYRTINPEMISSLRHLCIGLGIPVTNIQRINNRRTAMISGRAVTGKYDLFSFTCSDPGANRRIGSHDSRYIARFKAGSPFDRKGRRYPRHGGVDFDSSTLELSRIASIEHSSISEPVYDLEVEQTHSFIADGVVVSNSTNNNIEHQGLEYVQFTMGPLSENWIQEFCFALLSLRERDSVHIRASFRHLIKGDHAAMGDFINKMIASGVMNADEVRDEFLDMNPQADGVGKRYWKQVNTMPISADSQPPAPGPNQPAITQEPTRPSKPNGLAH